ncbi:MAG: T9SS type A sorting domain-containing protein [Bacteroidales bacterium]
MKKIKLTFTLCILLFAFCIKANAQSAWTQKTDFGGTARCYAVGFSIGTKGYIGTGTLDFGGGTKDFWEWDGDPASPSYNTWTQKADVGGQERLFAVGFSIGSKGYIGTGSDGNTNVGMTDFWEWDSDTASPSYNTWTQKAPFPGAARFGAVGFSIGTKGYIGTGRCDPNYYKDFWEYNSANDTWTQKADFGGTARAHATGFYYLDEGYIGTGYFVDTTVHYYKDFWQYNPANGIWTQKADYAGLKRICPSSFSISKNGYIGTGQDTTGSCNTTKDFWKYDMQNDTWIQVDDLTGAVREGAVGFSIGMKGYIGTGHTFTQSPYFNGFDKDLWEYDPFPVGISELSVNTVKVTVYPNPVYESVIFTIEGLQSNQPVEIQLYNATGKAAGRFTFSGSRYIMSRKGLPAGIYLYKILNNSKEIDSGKLIIE